MRRDVLEGAGDLGVGGVETFSRGMRSSSHRDEPPLAPLAAGGLGGAGELRHRLIAVAQRDAGLSVICSR